MDAAVILLMLLALIIPSMSEGVMRVYAFRFVRIIRLLLAMSKFSGLRTACQALTSSFRVVALVLVLSAVFLYSCSIALLFAWTGKLSRCTGSDGSLMHVSKFNCTSTEHGRDGILRPLVWSPG